MPLLEILIILALVLELALGLESLPEEMSYHTLAGFILAQLGRVPKEGHAAVYQGWRFEVVDMDGPSHRQGAGASRISTQGMKPDKSA